MNLINVKAMYLEMADVRRIDMAIGEKTMWGKGIGTAAIRMLVDYAFNGEYVEILHCFNEDYNSRARRVWEKIGFSSYSVGGLAPTAKRKVATSLPINKAGIC